jgi:hypothetical protein
MFITERKCVLAITVLAVELQLLSVNDFALRAPEHVAAVHPWGYLMGVLLCLSVLLLSVVPMRFCSWPVFVWDCGRHTALSRFLS